MFYDSRDRLLDLVIPFLKDGLDRREALVWAHPDFLEPSAIHASLDEAGIDHPALARCGQLELVDGARWYRRPDGSLKDVRTLVTQWAERERRALARGFSRLRVTGDASFTFATGDFLLFLEYEKTVHGLIGTTAMTALCTYGLTAAVTSARRHAITACHDPMSF